MKCRFCGRQVPAARVKATGKTHCMSDLCVTKWRQEQLEGYRLDLMPKVGMVISKVDDPVARTIGKSSGRQ